MLPTAAVVALALLVAGVSPATTSGTADRWEPAWLAFLVVVAVVLVGTAVLWWLLLVVRIQDRFRGGTAPRRRR